MEAYEVLVLSCQETALWDTFTITVRPSESHSSGLFPPKMESLPSQETSGPVQSEMVVTYRLHGGGGGGGGGDGGCFP